MENLSVNLVKGPNKSNYECLMRLTPREMQVLEMICDGMSNEEIATVMGIQVMTVKFHLKKVYDVFKARKRHTVIIEAVKAGLVRPSWVMGLT